MDVCKLGKIKVILGMLWLIAHNPEINWETEKVRIIRCLPLCGWTPKKKAMKKRQETVEDKRDLR